MVSQRGPWFLVEWMSALPTLLLNSFDTLKVVHGWPETDLDLIIVSNRLRFYCQTCSKYRQHVQHSYLRSLLLFWQVIFVITWIKVHVTSYLSPWLLSLKSAPPSRALEIKSLCCHMLEHVSDNSFSTCFQTAKLSFSTTEGHGCSVNGCLK